MANSIERLTWQIREKRGKTSEDRVAAALSLLEGDQITGFTRNKKLDELGIDFLVINGNKNYKISVKSSQGGVEWEKRRHPERVRRGDLIFVIPRADESVEDLAARILRMINDFEERMHQR